MNDPDTMTMLYKVADGSVKDQYYGESLDQHPENIYFGLSLTYSV